MSNILREQLADLCDEEIQSDSPSCYVLADAIIAALPNMVQPLVWYDCPDGTSHDANCRYEITPRKRSFRLIKGVTGGGSYICDAASMDNAKAAAQAHHVATIMQAFGVQGGDT